MRIWNFPLINFCTADCLKEESNMRSKRRLSGPNFVYWQDDLTKNVIFLSFTLVIQYFVLLICCGFLFSCVFVQHLSGSPVCPFHVNDLVIYKIWLCFCKLERQTFSQRIVHTIFISLFFNLTIYGTIRGLGCRSVCGTDNMEVVFWMCFLLALPVLQSAKILTVCLIGE